MYSRSAQCRQPSADLLTGFAEIDSAIAAVNQGRIFRFLSKPITPDDFKACLDDAVRQYQLVCAERELLEQTLRGSVKALVETCRWRTPRPLPARHASAHAW